MVGSWRLCEDLRRLRIWANNARGVSFETEIVDKNERIFICQFNAQK